MVTGHYEQKQLLSRSRIIAWSHGARFRLARALVQPYAGQRLLDYGCGDGTFLKTVSDLFPSATGADIIPGQVEDCRNRLSEHHFKLIDELDGEFDLVTCMEVLEHCTTDVVDRVLTHLSALVKPGGTLIISVPVEIGLMLVAKQTVRHVAGWRGIGDYKWTDRYTLGELAKMVLANAETSIPRALFYGEHTHKGFNWRALEVEIKRHFRIKERRFSPSSFLRSQVWFVCESTRENAL